ncbi:hypothetical protein PBI_KALPINE_41 [Mycobacterium phage Kalpine]|nr:hypothetical protein PBI_KALPINE_41 [Mycobacterium phage Kalpine]
MVTEKAVYFDGYELPWYISEDGIDFTPGGRDDFHRLRIEFLVDSATFKDSRSFRRDEQWYWLGRRIGLEFDMELIKFDNAERRFRVRG